MYFVIMDFVYYTGLKVNFSMNKTVYGCCEINLKVKLKNMPKIYSLKITNAFISVL